MRNLTGIFLMLMFLSGCIVTASSGTRTEYEEKMKKIEKDYREMKITKAEYNQLKDQANQQAKAGQKSGPMGYGQNHP